MEKQTKASMLKTAAGNINVSNSLQGATGVINNYKRGVFIFAYYG